MLTTDRRPTPWHTAKRRVRNRPPDGGQPHRPHFTQANEVASLWGTLVEPTDHPSFTANSGSGLSNQFRCFWDFVPSVFRPNLNPAHRVS